MQKTYVSMVTPRQRVRFGSRTLSKDEWSAVQTLNDATDGDIRSIRKLVRQLRKSGKGLEQTLAAIKHPHFRGRSPLHNAAWGGRLETCRFLVEELCLNVNAHGDDGVTPLSYAIFGCGSTSVVRYLLDRGAKPNKTSTDGFTALHFATMAGPQENSEAARLWAANTRDTCEIAELLLSRGAYVDPICEEGTPLLIAARNGNVRMLELLLRHQANVSRGETELELNQLYLRDGAHLSSLFLATLSKQPLSYWPLIMLILVAQGSLLYNMELKNVGDLHVSSSLNTESGCMMHLPNTVVHLVYTPLSYAISASSVKCMELLIKAGADVNAGRPVTTPLIVAASYGFASCIKCLLEAGADTNIPDEFGRTAAEIASIKGWMDCVEILSPLTYPVAISAGTDDSLLNANDGCALKKQGAAAFEENDYADALSLYTKAMEFDPDDSTLYAKRSLCWLHMSEEDKALDDAYTYRTMKMDLSNSCYEQTAALILVKEYARACRALVSALKLDLRSDDLD